MRIIQGFLIASRLVALSGGLTFLACGCNSEPAAGTDPAARQQTEADAKNAMQSASQQQKTQGKSQR
ncbi:MAG TPA: hypothetical protein VF590_19260 [Isosphaeraceae bacterium]|jgi:hypothetical protein